MVTMSEGKLTMLLALIGLITALSPHESTCTGIGSKDLYRLLGLVRPPLSHSHARPAVHPKPGSFETEEEEEMETVGGAKRALPFRSDLGKRYTPEEPEKGGDYSEEGKAWKRGLPFRSDLGRRSAGF